MKKIAIIVAMQVEEELMLHLLENQEKVEVGTLCYTRGTMKDKEIALVRCGIGKVNAAIMTTELVRVFQPDAVINSGVAGCISPSVSVGDVVVGEQCCYHDVWCGSGLWGEVQGLPARFDANEALLASAKSIASANIHFGLICTGDQFIFNIRQVEEIKRNFPDALAVDMESTSIAHTSYLFGVPFLALRVVSDTPGLEHDNATQYENFWVDAPKTTFEVLKQLISNL